MRHVCTRRASYLGGVRPSHTPGTGLAADLIHSLHLAFGPGAATESLEGDYVESRVNSTVYRWDSSTKGTLIDPNIDLLFYLGIN